MRERGAGGGGGHHRGFGKCMHLLEVVVVGDFDAHEASDAVGPGHQVVHLRERERRGERDESEREGGERGPRPPGSAPEGGRERREGGEGRGRDETHPWWAVCVISRIAGRHT